MVVTTFDQYKVTNGTVRWKTADSYDTFQELGCVGTLGLETELKTVTKKCEGDEVMSVDIPTRVNGTLVLHMPVPIFRKAFGLSNEGLTSGVYSYGTNSRPSNGIVAFDVEDLFGELKKKIAFPNLTFSGGLNWQIENGGEEIAMIETSFKALKDSNSKFYYEGFDSEITDENVKTKWSEEFTPDLVKETAEGTAVQMARMVEPESTDLEAIGEEDLEPESTDLEAVGEEDLETE